MSVEEQLPLRRLELLRVLLGVGERACRSSPNCSRTGPSTAASRCFSSSMLRLVLTWIWRWMSSSVESIEIAGASSDSELVDDRAGRDEPVAAGCAPRSRGRGRDSISAVRSWSSHFALPAWRADPPAPRRACGSRRGRARAPRGAAPRGPRRRRPRPSSGRPSCRRRSGRARSPPSSAATSG